MTGPDPDLAAWNRARAFLADHNAGRPVIEGDQGSTFVTLEAAVDAILALSPQGMGEGEAVAWRVRASPEHGAYVPDWPWRYCDSYPKLPENVPARCFEVQPLYASLPPRAGEADWPKWLTTSAELLENNPDRPGKSPFHDHQVMAGKLRAMAAALSQGSKT